MAELCFQPAGFLARQRRRAPCRRTWDVADQEVFAAPGGACDSNRLIDRHQRREIPFRPRRLLPGRVERLGGRAANRRSGAESRRDDRSAAAGGAGARYCRRPRSAGGGAGEGGGTAEPFSAETQSALFAEPAGFDRTAPDARGVRSHAAAAGGAIHDGGAGGAQDRRRRRAGPGRLPPDPWRDRGARRGLRDDGAGRLAPGGARGAFDDRRAPARQAAQPSQCRADHLARMDELDCARRAGESAAFRSQGGRVQKNGGHG